MAAQIIAFPIDTAQRPKLGRYKLLSYFEEIRRDFPDFTIEKAWRVARAAVAIDAHFEESPANTSIDDRADEPRGKYRPLDRTRASAAYRKRVASPAPPENGLPVSETMESDWKSGREHTSSVSGDLAIRNMVRQISELASGEQRPRNEHEARLMQLGIQLKQRMAELSNERAQKCI